MTGQVLRLAVLAVCPRCRRRFGHAAALRAHVKRAHPGRQPIRRFRILRSFMRDCGKEDAHQEEAAMR